VGEDEMQKYRLPLLKQFVERLVLKGSCDFTLKCKTFYATSATRTIFQCCSQILSDVEDGIYEYNSDGLIFTPANTGVASDKAGVAGKLTKPLWEQSFKWKPAEYNTVDFLVSVKKDTSGKDEIHHIFQDGLNNQGGKNIQQYKTLVLRCGYDELDRRHGFVNPYEDIIQNKVIEVATDALSDSVDEVIGIETIRSHFSRVRRASPLPSEPTIIMRSSFATFISES
jgi:hypothetical protein